MRGREKSVSVHDKFEDVVKPALGLKNDRKNLFISPRFQSGQFICHSKELVELSRRSQNFYWDAILGRD